MAFPKKSGPKDSDNRASTIRFGTPEEPKLDLANLQENAIIADVAEVVSEGNPVYEPAPAGTIPSAVPETTTAQELAPAPAPEAPAAPAATTETPAPAATESDEVDDPRFKGKSKAELYKAYQNLERLKGEHDTEVSQYRKLFMDRVLKPEMEAAAKQDGKPAENPDDPTSALSEFLTNPIEREKKVIAKAKKELIEELTGAARLNEVQQAFASKQAVIQSPEFKEWLTTNVPQHIAAAADQDINTFNFIMKAYETATGVSATGAQAPTAPTAPGAPAPDRRIPVGSAAGIPAASAAPGSSKPITFKQAELAEMMLCRPEEYARRQPEILAAYREGRIK